MTFFTFLRVSIDLKCEGNDCVSQVKNFDPVSDEKKAQRRTFIYIVPTVLIEHYLYERITTNFGLEYSHYRTCMTFQFASFRNTFVHP